MMKRLSMLLAGAMVAALGAQSAQASISDDLQTVRKLIPAGWDIAQYQANKIKYSQNDADSETAVKDNYKFWDFNGDGHQDLALIIEKNPTFTDRDDKPCQFDPNTYDCSFVFGPRTLLIYQGQADGSFKQIASNDKIVLAGDEGGVFGDPLNGLGFNARGSLTLGFYGGSSWRWSWTYTMQFRTNDFYMIGTTYSSMHNTEPDNPDTTESEDVDLITGKTITLKKGKTTTTYNKKPLVKLSAYVNPKF